MRWVPIITFHSLLHALSNGIHLSGTKEKQFKEWGSQDLHLLRFKISVHVIHVAVLFNIILVSIILLPLAVSCIIWSSWIKSCGCFTVSFRCVFTKLSMHLRSLESTESHEFLSAGNSYASLVLSKHPTCIYNSIIRIQSNFFIYNESKKSPFWTFQSWLMK